MQIRTHRPGQAPSNQAQSERPEILTVVTFPRSVTPTTKDVVYSITTYVVSVTNGQADPTSSMNTTQTSFANSRRWAIERDPTYQTFVDRMKDSKSPFLLPATVTKEGECRNVANMTASTLQRNAKAGQGNPSHPSLQSPLTPGHTLAIEGVQLDLSLNPGSKSSGMNGQAEWIIRMGWVGGAPNALNPGNNQATKGIIVEVSLSQCTCSKIPFGSRNKSRWNTYRYCRCPLIKPSKTRLMCLRSFHRSCPRCYHCNKSLHFLK